MSDLDQARELIARGEKDNAIALLASILMRNRDDVEAWLLLGETLDDPARKRDCYNQVLRLSPHGMQAATRLQELEEPSAPTRPSMPAALADEGARSPVSEEARPRPSRPVIRELPPSAGDSGNAAEIIVYVVGGIAAFLFMVYVISSPRLSSSDSNTLYLGLIFLTLVAGIIILMVSSKDRG
jgi:hypothetical protein